MFCDKYLSFSTTSTFNEKSLLDAKAKDKYNFNDNQRSLTDIVYVNKVKLLNRTKMA